MIDVFASFILINLFFQTINQVYSIGVTHTSINSSIYVDLPLQLAVNYINKNQKQFLLQVNTSYVQPSNLSQTVQNFYDRGAIGIIDLSIGDLNFEVVQNLSNIYRKPTIYPLYTIPLMYNTTNYPYFLRNIHSDERVSEAIIDFCLIYNFLEVGVLFSSDNYGLKGTFSTNK